MTTSTTATMDASEIPKSCHNSQPMKISTHFFARFHLSAHHLLNKLLFVFPIEEGSNTAKLVFQ